jgi:hypothetical protein
VEVVDDHMSHFVIQYEQHIPNHEVHQIFELRLWQLLEAWTALKRGRDGFDAFLESLALRRPRLREDSSGNSQGGKRNGPTTQTTAGRIHGSFLKEFGQRFPCSGLYEHMKRTCRMKSPLSHVKSRHTLYSIKSLR